jgi:phosphoserine aminotransferase
MTPYRFNFSAGPGALPESVLQTLQEAIHCVPELGLSVLGVSQGRIGLLQWWRRRKRIFAPC